MSNSTFRIPDTVIEDTRAFRREVEKYLAGEISPVAFRAVRVPMGIYEQRENDTYMVRVRGAGGVFLPHQARAIARLSREYGNGVVHATTRQDLQIHRVLAQDTPTVLEKLLEAGLSSRGGGGNTVRNVSACPLSGVCADEVFDVTPYALALTEYLISDRANFNLPRKFKCAFSGCGKDCALCSVADVGFFAHERDGVRGFAVYAGGGMGAQSALGIPVEEFIPAEGVFEAAEAVKRLFDKHGDRINRHKARLRFVVERVGEEEFRRLYREELDQVRREGISAPQVGDVPNRPAPMQPSAPDPSDPAYRAWRGKNASAQKQKGLFTVRVPLGLGDILADHLEALAGVIDDLTDGTIRTTQDQDLQLVGVPESNLHGLFRALLEIDESLVAVPSIKCVACAGASTCKLGLCLSRGLASAVEAELAGIESPFNAPIRISGCPNSCGQHPVGWIGLHGGAQRSDGKLVPIYSVVAGGRMSEGDASLARHIGKVPAKAVPALLRDFLVAVGQNVLPGETEYEMLERWGYGRLRELTERYSAAPGYDESPDYYRDYGSNEEFSLAGRGPGECGAGVMDVIALDIDEARRALSEGSLYDAVVSTARALLVTRGLEPKKDWEVFSAFSDYLVRERWVDPRSQALLDAVMDYKLGDRETLDDLRGEIGSLLDRVDQLFRSLDSNLNFRVEPLGDTEQKSNGTAPHVIDLRGVLCPMNFVRAKITLEQLYEGEILDILLDDGEPVRNVPASFADQGQEVVSVSPEGSHYRVRVRR